GQRREAHDPAVVDPGDRLRAADQRPARDEGIRIGQQVGQRHQPGIEIGVGEQQDRWTLRLAQHRQQQEGGCQLGDHDTGAVGGGWRAPVGALASLQISATEERMALPQDIRPVNNELADSITRSSEIPWIETKPGQAWTKVLWVGPESGRWAVLLKWKKGYIAPPHKHLSAAFAFVLSGKLEVRDNVYNA